MKDEGWRTGTQGIQSLMPSVSFGPSDLSVVRRIFWTDVIEEKLKRGECKIADGVA